MRSHFVDSGHATKLMIMTAIRKQDGRTTYYMSMSVINGSKSKIHVGMLNSAMKKIKSLHERNYFISYYTFYIIAVVKVKFDIVCHLFPKGSRVRQYYC